MPLLDPASRASRLGTEPSEGLATCDVENLSDWMSTPSTADSSATDIRLSVGEAAAQPIAAFRWTPKLVLYSVLLFVLAGLAEIGGGWLIFQAIRVNRPFWWGIIGSVVLIIYGFIPTLQPISNFGRVFAVYGGFFIVMSYAWGWLLSSERPDKGDYIGTGIAIGGVLIAWFWPRKTQKRSERPAFDAAARAVHTGPHVQTAGAAQPIALPAPQANLQQQEALRASAKEAAVLDAQLKHAPEQAAEEGAKPVPKPKQGKEPVPLAQTTTP